MSEGFDDQVLLVVVFQRLEVAYFVPLLDQMIRLPSQSCNLEDVQARHRCLVVSQKGKDDVLNVRRQVTKDEGLGFLDLLQHLHLL